jgi:exopolysaccharide biosynthesis operon protein EpsL
MKKANIAVLVVIALPICGVFRSTITFAAVEIPDIQDVLDKAEAGPDLIGGVYDNSFSIYVADTERYDTNLFRVPNGTDISTLIGPNATKQDLITSPSGGLDGQWGIGRQTINFALNVQDNRFSNNSNLNNVATTDKVGWNWGIGDVLTGEVGVQYLQALAGFVNANTYTRNIYSQTNYFAAGRYQLGPHWAVYGGVLESVFGLNQSTSKGNNSRSKSVDMGVDYTTDVQTTFGLDYRYTDARFPNAIALSQTTFDPDFREDRVRFLYKQMLSEKTTIDVNAGFLKRNYSNSVIDSFSGPIWRASLGWQPTGKTQLIVATWRNLQAYLTDQTNYYRSTGASISPQWSATDKISMSFSVSREDQSYIGTSPIALNQSARKDTVNAQLATLSYIPTRALSFNLSYRREQRSSNQPLRTYTDGLTSANVKFAF